MAARLSSPQWIDFCHCDDPRDVVHRAVACLAQGGVVGLATETIYCLAVSALQPEGIERVRRAELMDQLRPLSVLIKGPEEATDWVPRISDVGRRLSRRLWPGPLTLIFPPVMTDGLVGRLAANVRELVAPAGELALQCPADHFLADVLNLMPAPLVLGRMTDPDGSPPILAEPLRDVAGIDMVIDSGPTRYGNDCTAVRLEGEGWSLQHEGVIERRTLTQMSGMIVLFVCTGNTCRSPMAEGICKVILARKLGCSIETLEEKGYMVRSAGVAAVAGAPAAAYAAEVLREIGGSLDQHRSRMISLEMVRQADCIFAMTVDHLDALLDAVPEAQTHTFLLDPRGGDVDDPIGSDFANYRRTAEAIGHMLEERLGQMGL